MYQFLNIPPAVALEVVRMITGRNFYSDFNNVATFHFCLMIIAITTSIFLLLFLFFINIVTVCPYIVHKIPNIIDYIFNSIKLHC